MEGVLRTFEARSFWLHVLMYSMTISDFEFQAADRAHAVLPYIADSVMDP